VRVADVTQRRAFHEVDRSRLKILELRAGTGLARLWRKQGKLSEARDLLAPMYQWFTEGPNTRVLQEAQALLESLERKSSEDLVSTDSKTTSSCN